MEPEHSSNTGGKDMILRKTIAVMMWLCVTIPAAVTASGADCPERVAHWPYGSTTAIAHSGNYIVYGAGTVIKVAGVTDPAAPTVIAELRLGALILDLDASGTVAVVALFGRAIVIVDLSDPSHPSVAGSLDGLGGTPHAVALDGDTAWLATGTGLVAVDVGDPTHPEVLSSSDLDGAPFNDVVVSGDLVILSDLWDDRVYTVDISDPESPRRLGSVEVSWPVGAAFAGDFAYVADRITGVQVIDISDPSNPTIVTTVKEGGDNYLDVEVAGNLLLVAHRLDGLAILDITNPSAPSVLGRLVTAGQAESTAFADGIAFIADGHEGVAIAGLADPSQPEALATLPGSGPLVQLAVAGDLAAATDVGDLVLFDVSDPAAPAVVSTYDPGDSTEDVQLSGGYAYLALFHSALQVVDVTDPAHPEKVGSLEIERADLLAVDGERAVVIGDGLLTVADVSDPAHPTELGRLTLDYSRRPSGVFLAGNAAYVSEYRTGLHVIDLTDPAHPAETGLVEMNGADQTGAVQGDLLFLGDQGTGLRIFDISNRFHPRELSLLTGPRHFSGIGVEGNLLAVASIYNGIFIADISDPENPGVVGTSPMAVMSAADAVLDSGLFLVTERDGGMEIFDVADCAVEPPAASFTWSPAIPEAGHAVQFTGAGSGAITSWRWDFGDGGGGSTEQSPRRVFSRPGSFPVTLTVTGPEGHDAVTRVVTVSGGASGPPIGSDPGWRYLVPAAAHMTGLHGTSWVSDVVLHNPGTIGATAHLYFMERRRDNSAAPGWEIEVDAGSSVALDDIVLALFGRSATSGAILVASDRELVVTSRSYNDTPSGTYGQFIPGLPVVQAASTAKLIQLTRDSGFRTNIGIANPTGTAMEVQVRLRDDAGSQVGGVVPVPLDPYGYHQVTDIFPTDVSGGTAEVWTDTAGGVFFAYASVVDNVTGDPVFVLEAPSAQELWIPAAAHAAGFQGTQWRTDLELSNGSTSAPTMFTIELLESGQDNSHPQSRTLGMPPGATGRAGDILGEFFDYTGSAALRVVPSRSDAIISSRTYNQTADGTYGQYIPGVTGDAAVTPSHPARLVQLDQSAGDTTGLRTNIGLLNITSSSVDISIALHASDGAPLGTVAVRLQPYEYRQINKIFRSVTTSPVTNGYAVLTTTTADAAFLAYASVVDNASGDPVCILAR